MASAAGSKKRRDVRGTDDEMCACVSFARSRSSTAPLERLASRGVERSSSIDYY
jgi:hypothetical protein